MKNRVRHNRKGAALFVLVLSVTLIVAMLGLATTAMVRIDSRKAAIGNDFVIARQQAQSGVQSGISYSQAKTNWRNEVDNGVPITPFELGDAANGSMSWSIEDSDGSLDDVDTSLILVGIGLRGKASQHLAVEVQARPEDVGGGKLREMEIKVGEVGDDVSSSKWWCQFTKPDSLPVEALYWWVTRVELTLQNPDKKSGQFHVRLYEPDFANMPTTALLDEVSADASDIKDKWKSEKFDFTGKGIIAADRGVCIAIETSVADAPLEIEYCDGTVSELDSAMISGNPGWNTYDTNSALKYKLHGSYAMPGDTLDIVEGTWEWQSTD